MGLVEQFLAPSSELVLVDLDGRCGHRIIDPAAVAQDQGDDLPNSVVGQIRERASGPAVIDVTHQDDGDMGGAGCHGLARPAHGVGVWGHIQAAVGIEGVGGDGGVHVMIRNDHPHGDARLSGTVVGEGAVAPDVVEGGAGRRPGGSGTLESVRPARPWPK